MTQASLSPELNDATPSVHSTGAGQDGGRSTVTFWLFGLTAMTLVFASLLLLGLLMRSGGIDVAVRSAVSVYAAVIAAIGILAGVYVLAMGRRHGIFKSSTQPRREVATPTAVDDLIFAPAVLPRVSLQRRQEMAMAQEQRSRRARAIAAAAVSASLPVSLWNAAAHLVSDPRDAPIARS